MAERLTKEYYYTWDENGTKKLSYIQKLQNKLGKLEDILEEFNISSIDELHEFLCWEQEQKKELDKIYNVWEKYGCKTLQEVDDLLQDGCDTMCIMEENKKPETDRDTWKRACELACEKLADIYSHCEYELFGDSVDEYRKYCEENGNPLQNIRYCETKYFYQQAKKEGENK